MSGYKSTLIALLDKANQAIMTYAAGLDDETRGLEGTPEAWAPKDDLAHIGEWNIISALRIAASRRGQAPKERSGIDDHNAEIFDRYRYQSFEGVLTLVDAGHRELVNQIEALEEEDLLSPDLFPWLNGQSLLKRIAGGSYFHAIWHLIPHYLKSGDRTTADHLADQAIEDLLALDDSQNWRGQQTYNRACYYALAGETQKAIAVLREAFMLAPNMTTWAKQDTDLITIWEEPEFEELVKEYEQAD